MKLDLKKPCSNCPFRKDINPYLTCERAEEISDAILHEDKSFTCHKTLKRYGHKGEEQHCAGALIFLEKHDNPNQIMRMAERFGLYSRNELEMESPVFDSQDEFIEAQEKSIAYLFEERAEEEEDE